jgi:NO-binding membrane sensor protein with MHYT domain
MTAQNLLREYQGHIVPQSYNVGFVALSFVVSLVGAGSTLELINRRTGLRGLYNQYASPSAVSNLTLIIRLDC